MTTNMTLPALLSSVLTLHSVAESMGHSHADAEFSRLQDAILDLTHSPETLVQMRSVFANMLSFSHEHDPSSEYLGRILDSIDECLRACDPVLHPADAEMRLTFGHFN